LTGSINPDDCGTIAFPIFVVLFCGILAAATVAMGWIAVMLVRRNRKKLE
jgi:hypothetical protein